MDFVKNIDYDECRSAFCVTSERKRVWNVELNLLREFDEACRRHGLKYMAIYGTLLGAVRHKGFIPWDDDIDVVMLRPDYEKLKEIAPKEFKAPYFFQNIYTDPNFIMAFSKLRDSRTTAVQYPDFRPEDLNQGIFIDIYPFDSTDDGTERTKEIIAIQTDLWATVYNPWGVQCALAHKSPPFHLEKSMMQSLLYMPKTERMKMLEAFNLECFSESSCLNFLTAAITGGRGCKRECFEGEPIEVPFEETRIWIPNGYESALVVRFGENWREFVRSSSAHEGIIFDVNTPYYEYLAKPRI